MKYNDPLHVGYAELTVVDLEGRERYVLSKRLLDSQNCWQNLEALKDAHQFKLMLYSMIEDETDVEMLKQLAEDITLVEFELQRLWGFTENRTFHRFWETPKCVCPHLDNEERIGTPYQIINTMCSLHGNRVGTIF